MRSQLWPWSTGTSAKVAPDTACCSLFWEIETKMKIFEKCGVDKKTKIAKFQRPMRGPRGFARGTYEEPA
jgi:hypothetical protein